MPPFCSEFVRFGRLTAAERVDLPTVGLQPKVKTRP